MTDHDTPYRVRHAAGILDGLRTVAVLVAEDMESERSDESDRLWAVASDIVNACDDNPDNLTAAVNALSDEDKATAYLWAALDLLNLAEADSGDPAIGKLAGRCAQLARARP